MSQQWTSSVDPATGKTFYLNPVTGETSWTPPGDCVPPPDKPPASKEEEEKQAAGDAGGDKFYEFCSVCGKELGDDFIVLSGKPLHHSCCSQAVFGAPAFSLRLRFGGAGADGDSGKGFPHPPRLSVQAWEAFFFLLVRKAAVCKSYASVQGRSL